MIIVPPGTRYISISNALDPVAGQGTERRLLPLLCKICEENGRSSSELRHMILYCVHAFEEWNLTKVTKGLWGHGQ